MGRRGSTDRGQRDAFDPSLDDLLSPLQPLRPLVHLPLLSELSPLIEVEDRRRFTPYDASPRSMEGTPARLRVVGRGVPSHRIGFTDPSNVVACVRRAQRREVLFAKRRTKKGAGARRRRRNFWSNVRC